MMEVRNGGEILHDVCGFATSVLYGTDEQLDTLTLANAATHTLDSFSTIGHLLATGPLPECGKTTLLDLVVMLAANGWMANPTSYAIRAKFNEPERPTIIVDEISEVFGKSGLRGRGNPLGRILRECYRSTATLSMAVDRVAEDVSCFSMAAISGLKTAVPDDIRTRCIVFNMRPLPESVTVRDSQDSDTQALGAVHREVLHQWAASNGLAIRHAFRNMRLPHPKFTARRAQIWGPLYAVALVAGGDWPQRCLAAFKAMALDASDLPVLNPAQMTLRDAARIFRSSHDERMFAADMAAGLRGMGDIELYDSLTNRGLAQLLTEALGPTTVMRIGDRQARGFYASEVTAAWDKLEARLTPAVDDGPGGDEYDVMFDDVGTEVQNFGDGTELR